MMQVKQIKHQFGLLCVLLVNAVAAGEGHGFWKPRNDVAASIPEWFPNCLKTDSFISVVNCLGQSGQALCNVDTTTISFSMAECVSNAIDVNLLDPDLLLNPDASSIVAKAVGSLNNVSRYCLDPFVDCAGKTIQKTIDSVLEPTCLSEKLSSLSKCALQNGATCRDACLATWVDTTHKIPWEGLDKTTISTCNNIQTNLLDPSCAVFTCCEPCAQPYEELMDCLVNQVLNYTEEVCDFKCALSTS
jgi:hypothetical protein